MSRKPTAPFQGRGFKRFARKQGMSCPLQEAYMLGMEAAYSGRPNPYPRGKRHENWAYGFQVESEDRRRA